MPSWTVFEQAVVSGCVVIQCPVSSVHRSCSLCVHMLVGSNTQGGDVIVNQIGNSFGFWIHKKRETDFWWRFATPEACGADLVISANSVCFAVFVTELRERSVCVCVRVCAYARVKWHKNPGVFVNKREKARSRCAKNFVVKFQKVWAVLRTDEADTMLSSPSGRDRGSCHFDNEARVSRSAPGKLCSMCVKLEHHPCRRPV